MKATRVLAMGFLDRLLGRPASQPQTRPRTHQPTQRQIDEREYWSRFDNHMRMSVVGESFYQDAIIKVSGAPASGEFRHECTACLVPEPTNPHDKFAVRVEIDGTHVGYLPRGSARRYHRRLVALLADGGTSTCFAFVGRRDGENPNLGVSLRVPNDHPLLARSGRS